MGTSAIYRCMSPPSIEIFLYTYKYIFCLSSSDTLQVIMFVYPTILFWVSLLFHKNLRLWFLPWRFLIFGQIICCISPNIKLICWCWTRTQIVYWAKPCFVYKAKSSFCLFSFSGAKLIYKLDMVLNFAQWQEVLYSNFFYFVHHC